MNSGKRPRSKHLFFLASAAGAFWVGASELFGAAPPNEASAATAMLIGFALTFVAAVGLREEM